MEVHAYLYPNPPFQGPVLTDIWGNSYQIQNEPFLEVKCCGLARGEYTITLLTPVRQERSLRVVDDVTTVYFSHPRLADPSISQVTVALSKSGDYIEHVELPILVHRIHGQVQDFDGHPFPSYLWAVEDPHTGRPQAMVQTDEEGRFSLWYPAGKRVRLFIDDESYSQTTYECWVTIETLREDIEIHPRVGTLEIWGLQVWHTEIAWHIYFWPCSLTQDLRAKQSGWQNFPHLRLQRQHVRVHVNGQGVNVEAMHALQAWGGYKRVHSAYLLDIAPQTAPVCHPTYVQVEVQTKTRGRGEAWYILNAG